MAFSLSASAHPVSSNMARFVCDVTCNIHGTIYGDTDLVSMGPIGAQSLLASLFPAPSRIGVDACFVQPPLIVFSTDVDFTHGGTTYAHNDLVAYHVTNRTLSMYWNGRAHGLPPQADLNAATRVDDHQFLFSVDIDATFSNESFGAETTIYKSSVYYSGPDTNLYPRFGLYYNASELMPGYEENITSLHLQRTNLYYSVERAMQLPVLGFVSPGDVVCIRIPAMFLDRVISLPLEGRGAVAALDAVTDTDGDGLSDYEEVTGMDEVATTWPGTSAPLDPQGYTSFADVRDTDGDGLTDSEEAMAGTDPRDPMDYFRVTEIRKEGQTRQVLSWRSSTNRLYNVQSARDPTLAFADIAPLYQVTGKNPYTTVTNTSPATNLVYRVLLDIAP